MKAQQFYKMELEDRLASVRDFARAKLMQEGLECPNPFEFREFLEINKNDESYEAWCAMLEAAYVIGFSLGQMVRGLQCASTSHAEGRVR